MALDIGCKAPDFTLPSNMGEDITLSDYVKSRFCVLYFYPKDFTVGCTKEACEFRDGHELFLSFDIKVIGVSRDSDKSHQKFIDKYNLPFPLLSDVNGKVCKAYKALIPILRIPKRVTYLIDFKMEILFAHENFFNASSHVDTIRRIVSMNK